MRRLLCSISFGLLAACTSKAPAAPQVAGHDVTQADAGEALSAKLQDPGEHPGETPYRMEPDKLDRFISYQERSLALYSKMLDELSRAEAQDGGAASSVARVRKHAAAQEHLRRELGLSERDVREMERIVGDVVARRAMVTSGTQDDSLQQMRALAAQMPEEQRAEFQATLATLERQQQQAAALTEERRKYGDANVELVLTREAQLARQWNRAIAAFSGAKLAATRADAGTPEPGGPDAGLAGADAGR